MNIIRKMRHEEATKEGLLKHYSKREPAQFIQFDAWVGVEGGARDSIIHPDEDGDWLCQIPTYELMLGPYIQKGKGARVLITPKTKAKDAVRVLRKIAHFIESGLSDLSD